MSSSIWIDPPVRKRSTPELNGLDVFKEPDWDGEGAQSISDVAITRATDVLTLLPIGLPCGNAMAGVDGSLGIYWRRNDLEIYLDFRSNGAVRFYYFTPRRMQEGAHASDVDAPTIVKSVQEALIYFNLSVTTLEAYHSSLVTVFADERSDIQTRFNFISTNSLSAFTIPLAEAA